MPRYGILPLAEDFAAFYFPTTVSGLVSSTVVISFASVTRGFAGLRDTFRHTVSE